MSNAPYTTLISEVLPIQRRDFYLADPTILNPNATIPLLDGEFLELDTSYKMVRASGEQTKAAWQVFAERGRYDTQAIGKVPVLFIGGYEAETSIVTTSNLAVGGMVMVTDVAIGGQNRRGLANLATGSGQHLFFGWVTRLPTGKVRYFVPAAGGSWKTV